jgi:hypothetical protein
MKSLWKAVSILVVGAQVASGAVTPGVSGVFRWEGAEQSLAPGTQTLVIPGGPERRKQ